MRIGIVAPSSVPFTIGGAERLWAGLSRYLNEETGATAELIKLPSPERSLWEVVDSYRQFVDLDLDHFDVVISGKYPAWMVSHRNHVCYMLHRLRGLYDSYPPTFPQEVDCGHSEVESLLSLFERHDGKRETLPEVFERLESLRHNPPVDPQLFAHPGPFIRKLVHFLDGVGLSSGQITQYRAISRTVARRSEYFPRRVPIEVVYPPSDLDGFRCLGHDYLFTASRLGPEKRVSLLVEAMRQVDEDIDLLIAGAGSEEAALRDQARDDPRIKLLGFVPDRELLDLYAHALAVPFVPEHEDFGLITLEAMKSGKPVLTTTDAGGPTELVVDRHNGLVVQPEPEALARAIQELVRDRSGTRSMGRAAHRSVEHIDWPAAVESLIPGLPKRRPLRLHQRTSKGRRKITVATTFPISPVRGGGQARIFHLFRALSEATDVEVVTLDAAGTPPQTLPLANGFREIRIPRSAKHELFQAQLSEAVGWIPVTDVAFPELYFHTPAYLEALRSSAADADLVVASHPYPYPAIREACSTEVWYEAQDVEVDLKSQLLPDNETGARLLSATRDVEALCCDEARRILVCAERDGQALKRLYGIERSKLQVVANGVDVEATSFIPWPERRVKKKEMGLEATPLALFVGSWHEPNVDAVKSILRFAPELPTARFLVAGSVGMALQDEPLPPNVGFLGVVEDPVLNALLEVCDLAINPMRLGSGTNLKVLEYCAAGVPVLSTPYGLRGLDLEPGSHVAVADLSSFARRVADLLESGDKLAPQTLEARRFVEEHYSWAGIAGDLATSLPWSGHEAAT